MGCIELMLEIHNSIWNIRVDFVKLFHMQYTLRSLRGSFILTMRENRAMCTKILHK